MTGSLHLISLVFREAGGCEGQCSVPRGRMLISAGVTANLSAWEEISMYRNTSQQHPSTLGPEYEQDEKSGTGFQEFKHSQNSAEFSPLPCYSYQSNEMPLKLDGNYEPQTLSRQCYGTKSISNMLPSSVLHQPELQNSYTRERVHNSQLTSREKQMLPSASTCTSDVSSKHNFMSHYSSSSSTQLASEFRQLHMVPEDPKTWSTEKVKSGHSGL
ncbi:uncharacterized protein [Watersipora subatra]|uniref:uncharacterized protein n=1 Tax=Watersipora subatra TaxID=2589382 RepID=UPI00355BC98A